jgi:transposase InsO family protein
MGRPSTGCFESFSTIVKKRILDLRRSYPAWGSLTIYIELTHDKSLGQLRLPKPSTIASFLKSKGLTKEYEKHIPLPGPQLHPASFSHHIWQIDAQGATEVPGLGRINLINIKDVFSKTYCGCLPAIARSHNGSPSAEDYRLALRLAFIEFGLPRKIQVDHAGVFFENNSKSPFPTRFHLWLVSLGIDLIFSRKHRPTDQSIVERSHQTLSQQIHSSTEFRTLEELHAFCDQRRARLNYSIPSRSTHKKPPLVANPSARFSGNYYQPQLESSIVKLERIYAYIQQGAWIRKVNQHKTLFLGNQWYYVNQAKAKSKLLIKFDPETHSLLFYNDKELAIHREPIKGISLESIMGDSFLQASLPGTQLKLPFTFESNDLARLF